MGALHVSGPRPRLPRPSIIAGHHRAAPPHRSAAATTTIVTLVASVAGKSNRVASRPACPRHPSIHPSILPRRHASSQYVIWHRVAEPPPPISAQLRCVLLVPLLPDRETGRLGTLSRWIPGRSVVGRRRWVSETLSARLLSRRRAVSSYAADVKGFTVFGEGGTKIISPKGPANNRANLSDPFPATMTDD